jgi:hypothetical protein
LKLSEVVSRRGGAVPGRPFSRKAKRNFSQLNTTTKPVRVFRSV